MAISDGSQQILPKEQYEKAINILKSQPKGEVLYADVVAARSIFTEAFGESYLIVLVRDLSPTCKLKGRYKIWRNLFGKIPNRKPNKLRDRLTEALNQIYQSTRKLRILGDYVGDVRGMELGELALIGLNPLEAAIIVTLLHF